MSLRISMAVICDGCGQAIVRADEVKITNVAPQWAEWRYAWTKEGRKIVSRPKFMVVEQYRRASKTYCLPCADGASAEARKK